MSDMDTYGVVAPKNEYKILEVFAGKDEGASGESWVTVLARAMGVYDQIDDYFAPGLASLIGIEGNTTFSISTANETKAALGDLMDKMKKTPIGKLTQGAMSAGRMIGGIGSGQTDAEGEAAADPPRANRNKFLESLGLPGNVRFQTDLSQLPAWQGTSPVKLESITFNFQMGMTGAWDARREVYNPIIALAAANLPTKDGSFLKGPLPSQEYILGTIVGDIIAGSGGGGEDGNGTFNVEAAVNGVLDRAESAAMYELYHGNWTGIWGARLGRVRLPDFYVGSTSHTFSTDTDDNGFPISGKVTWSEIKSFRVAHRGLETFKLYGKDD